MYSIIRLGLIIFLQHLAAEAGSCYYNVEDIRICNGKTRNGRKFNIYHTSPLNSTYHTACSCTVTGETIQIDVTNVPGYPTCGTSLYVIKPDGSEYNLSCSSSLGDSFTVALENRKNIKIGLRTETNLTSSSVFCLYLTGFGSDMNINCGSGTSPTFSTSKVTVSSFSSANVSESESKPTTQRGQNTTIFSREEQPSTSSREEPATTTSSREGEPTTTSLSTTSHMTNMKDKGVSVSSKTDIATSIMSKSVTESKNKNIQPRQQIRIEIVAPAAGGGFLLVLILTISCICFRKRKTSNESSNSDLKMDHNYVQSVPDKNNTIRSENDDEMRVNSLYESSDDSQFDVKVDHLDDFGGGYSEMQTFSQPKYNDGNYSGIELFSQVNHHSSCNDYTDVDLAGTEKQRSNDFVGNYHEISSENLEVSNREERDFPVYAMPIKDSKKISKCDTNNEEGPVYAYPIKKYKPDHKEASKTGGTKPIVMPKPMPKPEKL